MSRPSYAHGTSSIPLLGETIGENLRRTVTQHPDRDALVACAQGVRMTYRELWEATTRAARGLMALGVQKGDRVGIWSPNRFEWVVIQYATARVGAILVNINPAYRTSELEYALRAGGVSVLLAARRFRQTNYPAMIAEVRPRLSDLREVLVIDDDWQRLLDAAGSVDEAALAAREASL
jgi:fatty-acyl-CoA synthase